MRINKGVYERYNSSVIGVQEVPEQDVSKYGVISINQNGIEDGVYHINNLVEKPKTLNQIQMVVGYEFEGERHDVGEKFGFVKVTVVCIRTRRPS
jgi:UTP--glucose-1-phosphate uridylyltransferase